MVCPATACSTTSAQAPRNARRSGDWWASMGVGTQMMITSASASSAGSVVSHSESARRWVVSRSWSRGSRSTRLDLMSSSRSSLTS